MVGLSTFTLKHLLRMSSRLQVPPPSIRTKDDSRPYDPLTERGKGIVKKMKNGRHIRTEEYTTPSGQKRVRTLHATKGWRDNVA